MAQPSAAPPGPPVDLVARFERICAGDDVPRVARLVSNDAPARLATLQGLYQRLVEHPRFGGGWPWSLPMGALAPALPPSVFPGIPPRMLWFGLCATGEPAAEAAQLCQQLDQLNRFADLDPWVHEAAGSLFAAALLCPDLDEPGARQAQAFGFLDRLPGTAADLAAAVRTLSAASPGVTLLADAGTLDLDGADPRTRGVVAAGWLERLARTTPVLLALDEAQRAGGFASALVETLLLGDAPVLVVLAGQPVEEPGARALDGPLGALAAPDAHPFSLPAGDAGYLAAALAALGPDGLVTDHHVAVAATALGVGDEAATLEEELVAGGWLRPVAAGVHAFGNAARHRGAELQAPAMVAEIVAATAPLCRDALERVDRTDALGRLVAMGALADAEDPSAEVRWPHALLLARSGQPARAAERMGALADGPLRRSIVAAWRHAGRSHTAGSGAAAASAASSADHLRSLAANDAAPTPADEVERRVVVAGALAAVDPDAACEHLVAALAALERVDGATPGLARLRLAVARSFLTIGQLDGLARALGPEAPSWLPGPVVKRLVELHAGGHRPGVVARSIELAQLGRAVHVLRDLVPASRALALAQLALAARMERYGRLRAGDDAANRLLQEATATLRRTRDAAPLDLWAARTLDAACRLADGDAGAVVATLTALVDEQSARLAADHPTVLDAKLWLGRGLLAAERPDAAAAVFEQVRVARAGATGADPTTDRDRQRLDAEDGLAAALAAAGRHGDAADAAASVVGRRAAGRRDDEDLLASRLVLGAALVRTGHLERALRELDEVVARRDLIDLPDSPRVLQARHQRAECLMLLRRYPEAQAELDLVVGYRAALRPATDPTLVAARTDRALCLLMAHRWPEALAELDLALAVLHVRRAPDDEHLLVVRQQRAVCLHALGRPADAVAELDGVVAATATWPRDHRLVAAVLRQRGEIAAAVAALGER